MGSRNLAFLSVGLGSLGLICLLVAMVGSYAPTKTMMMQEVRFAHKPPQQAVGRQLEFNAKLGREAERKVRAAPKKGTKKANGQQLKLTFAGDTPLGDDDFDAAGYNMEGVWDWKLGRFRSPKFEHEPVIDAYEDPETGDHLEVPGCEPDDSLPKAILYDDCGSWPRWEWNYEKQCWRSWWGWYYGCWRHTYVPMEMPDGGSHELPMGFYSRLGAECYDDRPINIVKERTRSEAAWMGGCLLDGCIEPNTCSAIELPDGVNIQLYDQPNFMGYTIGFQGPVQIPCLDTRGWNDRIASVKVQNSIGLDSPEPLPVDRIHGVNWIYPDGPDSSLSKYDPYFNQWDELDSSPHEWQPLAEGMDGDGVDTITPEAWQADVNNLY